MEKDAGLVEAARALFYAIEGRNPRMPASS